MSMYSREPRYRGTHSQATPWSVGPSRFDDVVHPVAADEGLSLIAVAAKDKVQGRTNQAQQQQTVFRGRVSAGSSHSTFTPGQQRLNEHAQARINEQTSKRRFGGLKHIESSAEVIDGGMRDQARILAGSAAGTSKPTSAVPELPGAAVDLIRVTVQSAVNKVVENVAPSVPPPDAVNKDAAPVPLAAAELGGAVAPPALPLEADELADELTDELTNVASA